MKEVQELCIEIGQKLKDAGKNKIVSKLTNDIHSEALSLVGSKLSNPSDKKRAMKEWVTIGPNSLNFLPNAMSKNNLTNFV